MHFERNNLITDTMEDEELLTRSKQNKGKKLYGIYLLSILSEEANEDNPFTVKMLCLRLLERYGVFADITTIQSYIKTFQTLKDFTLKGLPNDGYYLKPLNNSLLLHEEERLDDYQIHYLIEYVRSSRNLSKTEKNSVIEKLSSMCYEEINKDYLLRKHIVYSNQDKRKSLLITRLFSEIPEILRENLILEIKEKHKLIQSRFRKFYLYATIPAGDYPILVGASTPGGNARILPSGMIEDYRVIEDEHFEKLKLKLKPSILLGEERIEFLKLEYPDIFEFPTDKELRDWRTKIQLAQKDWKNRKASAKLKDKEWKK